METGQVYNVELYRHSHQGLSLGLERDSPLQEAYENTSHLGRRTTSNAELETKSSGHHRKRVPVACDRCRKRKIKCSGDEGDGRGCINCKNAGWNGCQFLRVQSWNAHVNPSLSGGRNWQQQHRYHPYSSTRLVANVPHHHAFASQNLLPYTAWPHPLEATHCQPSHSSPPFNRPSYGSACSIYEGDPAGSYAGQPPSYMLPDPEHSLPANIACVGNLGRNQHSPLWYDQVNGVSIPQQNNQMLSSLYPLTPAESHKSFQGLNFPNPLSLNTERLLPTLSSSRDFASAGSINRYTPPLSALSYKSPSVWHAETASDASQSSARTSGSGSDSVTELREMNNSTTPEIVFPYTTTSQSSHVIRSVPTGVTEIVHAKTLPSQASETKRSRSRNARDDTRPCSPGCSAQGYSHASAILHKRRQHTNTESTRALINGLPYTWNPPANSRDDVQAEEDEEDLGDKQIMSTRASLASLNNASTY